MILNWHDTYKERLTDVRTALSHIRRGARIFIGSACGEPQLLVKTLIDVASNLADTEIIHFLDLGLASYTDEKYNANFRHNALFIGSNTRAAIKEGRADYTPIGHPLKTHLEPGVYELEIPFSVEKKEEV
jgi:acyl-CoA hydrolase